MQNDIVEIFDIVNSNASRDVNEKLAILGAVIEAVIASEVKPDYRSQAVDNFMNIVRRRTGAVLN